MGKVPYIFDLAVYSVTILILTVGGTFGTSLLKLDTVGVSAMKFILYGMIYAIWMNAFYLDLAVYSVTTLMIGEVSGPLDFVV